MRGILTGRRGLAPIALVIIIAWALAAVLMLTGTIIAANRIDDDVAIITPEVNDIGTDTKAIALASQTAQISGRIADVAQPLTGELADTLTAARGIDKTAKSIITRAGAINTTVKAINSNARAINGNVSSIGANASAINANALAINASARSIRASAQSINGNAKTINSSVVRIRTNGSGILSNVRSIDTRVAGINKRAVAVRTVARPLGLDLNSTLGLLPSINSAANGIDCSNLINSAGRTSGCQR